MYQGLVIADQLACKWCNMGRSLTIQAHELFTQAGKSPQALHSNLPPPPTSSAGDAEGPHGMDSMVCMAGIMHLQLQVTLATPPAISCAEVVRSPATFRTDRLVNINRLWPCRS